MFNNRGFYKGQDAPAWGCGCRHVAALVANLRGKGESYQDYYPGNTELAGTAIERQLQSRIDQISKSLTTDPPLAAPVWDLGARLGPGHHSADEVRQATQSMVPEFEKRRAAEREAYRERQRSELDKALWSLAVIRERHLNDDVFDALWAHLRRLGWRTETDEDRKRVRQEWVSRSLQVLQEVKEMEQRPAAPPGAWIEPLRNRRVKPLRLINREALERMPADVRVVSTGELYRRLWDLALTGRVTEQEYRALTERSSQSSRYGVRANRRGAVS